MPDHDVIAAVAREICKSAHGRKNCTCDQENYWKAGCCEAMRQRALSVCAILMINPNQAQALGNRRAGVRKLAGVSDG